MEKLGFSKMSSLDQLRSSQISVSRCKDVYLLWRPTSDSISIKVFANFKLTSDKLVKHQSFLNMDLEMAILKLKKSTEHLDALEEKLQKEDVKLWKGLESKFSDQLNKTLQQLAGQVQDAEDKLNASSSAFDSLQLSGISVKPKSAEKNMKKHEQHLLKLKTKKEEKEKAFMDEYNRTCKLIEGKDSLSKRIEEAVSAEKVHLENLTSHLEEVHHDLHVKEDICQHLRVNNDYAYSLLQSAFDTCYKLVQKEKGLIVKQAQCQFDQLHNRFLHVASENTEFQSGKEELNKQVIELQKDQDVLIIRHARECRITEVKIQGLESQFQTLVLKKADLELQVAKLEESIHHLSEMSTVSKNKKQDLMLRISTLESEKQDIEDQLQVKIQGKSEEIEELQNEIVRHKEVVDSLQKQASQLRDILMKTELHIHFTDREKLLEDQRTEILVPFAVAENTLSEAKQYDLLLESKQLKEISQKNDQATNDIRRKLELEKLEIINPEKEKNRRNIVGFPTQMMILLMTCLFFTPVVSASGAIFEGLVTLERIEIFTTHEWLKSTPIVYFRCQGENKTVLFDVKKKNVVYAFKGDESWQPLTEFTSKKCKSCGFYEEDTIGSDDVYDEWEFCPSDFMPPRGRYILFNGKELNATFLCPLCKGSPHFSEVPVGSPHFSEVTEEKKHTVAVMIIIISILFGVCILGAAGYIYWRRHMEKDKTQFVKMFEDGYEI